MNTSINQLPLFIEEEYRDIEGYEGVYQVSNTGKVRSLKYGKTRELKPGTGSYGYPIVNLSKDGVTKTSPTHKLVAGAFLEKIEGKNYVDHRDHNPQNNCVNNLRFVTQRENCQNLKANKEGRSTSKFVGVCWHKRDKKFQTQIRINNKVNNLGYYHNEAVAALTYDQGLKSIGLQPANINSIDDIAAYLQPFTPPVGTQYSSQHI